MKLATKTLDLIEKKLSDDQGANYRFWLGKVIPHMADAYSNDKFPFRGHLGASMIGHDCSRALWYGFRWVRLPKFKGRLLRLFNRGHLEEARFIALLLMIGVDIIQQDVDGRQFRISGVLGHFGGSGDGVAFGIPDVPNGEPVLCEFKTSNDKQFKKLIKEGVERSKFVHFVQMQIYMYKMDIKYALYMCVNKNDDDIHAEIITLVPQIAQEYEVKAGQIIKAERPPIRISSSPGWYSCKFCSFNDICHFKESHEKTCRTCDYVTIGDGGKWVCSIVNKELSKNEQLKGCDKYKSVI